MNPPGMSSAQLSTSMARTNAASSVAASTNHAADSPSAVPVTPAMKNAPMPSWAIASAAAFRTDMNGSSAVDDSTTRIGRRGRIGEKGDMCGTSRFRADDSARGGIGLGFDARRVAGSAVSDQLSAIRKLLTADS